MMFGIAILGDFMLQLTRQYFARESHARFAAAYSRVIFARVRYDDPLSSGVVVVVVRKNASHHQFLRHPTPSYAPHLR